jgi:hypothetical protein
VLTRLFRLLEHGLLGAEIHLSDLLLNAPELGRQCEPPPQVAEKKRDPSLINGASSSSNKSMSSSEVVAVGVSTFSFTLHSCFVGIIGQMMSKYSSLSFLATSSLISYAHIDWILLLWLGVRPRGHQ